MDGPAADPDVPLGVRKDAPAGTGLIGPQPHVPTTGRDGFPTRERETSPPADPTRADADPHQRSVRSALLLRTDRRSFAYKLLLI